MSGSLVMVGSEEEEEDAELKTEFPCLFCSNNLPFRIKIMINYYIFKINNEERDGYIH